MMDAREAPIAQPGMTAWGRAAERELEAYGRSTALRAPEDLTERVMVALEAEMPSRRAAWLGWLPRARSGRLQSAAGLVAVLLMTTAGAALAAAGASAIIRGDAAAPTLPGPEQRPVVVAEPTPTLEPETDDPSPTPRETVEAPKPPPPNQHDAVEATDPPDRHEAIEPPEATNDIDGPEEPEAADDPDDHEGGDEPDETEEPDDGGSSGGSGEGEG
jgi:hypothetical protein